MRLRVLAASLVLLALVSGCFGASGKCTASQGGTGQSGACVATDAFSYGEQGGPITKTVGYDWENTKGGAQVALGSQGTGSIKVTLKDAAGTQVLSKTFTGPGQFGATEHAQHGKAGTWRIDLAFTNVNGQIGLAIGAE
jgi:hypothetical protein